MVDGANGDQTVLLVEDDDAVREFAGGVLREAGYKVIDAADGLDAIAKAENYSAIIHLLVTDLVIPKLQGRDLAHILSEGLPGIKVLFISGYTDESIVQQDDLLRSTNFLAKPFSPEDLLEKVRSVLAAPVRPKSVLILDDEEAIRDLFGVALESVGYETVQCANGREALKQLQLRPVDLVITDLVMPDQEGLEFITTVRQQFADLKILAISGYAGGQFLNMARMLGANDTLSKPVNLDVLFAKVKSMVGG